VTSGGRRGLAFQRQTETWQMVYFVLAAKECFDRVEADEIFWLLA
jgi:hypothetical protein